LEIEQRRALKKKAWGIKKGREESTREEEKRENWQTKKCKERERGPSFRFAILKNAAASNIPRLTLRRKILEGQYMRTMVVAYHCKNSKWGKMGIKSEASQTASSEHKQLQESFDVSPAREKENSGSEKTSHFLKSRNNIGLPY